MSSTSPKAAPRRLALILSGGGARGAYEVGVLSYLFNQLARLRGGPPRIDVLSGTSVGAINACHLAAHLDDPAAGMRRLVDLWSRLELPHVLGFGMRQVMSLPRILTGGGAGTGVFDAAPMAELVLREVPWRAITRSLRQGRLRALSVSATEVASGRTVVFMHLGPDAALPTTAPPRTIIRAERIGPQHALASAAIPILFPPVKIGSSLYVDGGLRQNTPIAPALRMGATHVFAIGLSRDVRGVDPGTSESAPGAAFLLGKVLNAFLLDHVQSDIELLERLNGVLADGMLVYGDQFLGTLSSAAVARGAQPYRPVRCLEIRPSEDIGRLAADYVRRGKLRGGPVVTRRILQMLDVGVGTEADLASYLLFDGDFCRKLVDLGCADASARREELLDFFGKAEDDAQRGEPGASEPPAGDWTLPPPAVG